MNIKSLLLSLLGISVTSGAAVGGYFILNPKKSKNTDSTNTDQPSNTVRDQQQSGLTSSTGAEQIGEIGSSATVNRGGSSRQDDSDGQDSSPTQSADSASEPSSSSSNPVASQGAGTERGTGVPA